MAHVHRCELERALVTGMVERVLHVTQVSCRRKKKLVKIWHKPKPGEQQKPTRERRSTKFSQS